MPLFDDLKNILSGSNNRKKAKDVIDRIKQEIHEMSDPDKIRSSFMEAFEAIKDDVELGKDIWQAWLEHHGEDSAALLKMMNKLKTTLPMPTFENIIEELVLATVQYSLDHIDKFQLTLEQLVFPAFGITLSILDAKRTARLIYRLLLEEDSTPLTLSSLNILDDRISRGVPNTINLDTLKLPGTTWVVTFSLHRMIELADLKASMPIDDHWLGGDDNPFRITDKWVSGIPWRFPEFFGADILLQLLMFLFELNEDFEIEWALMRIARFTPVGIVMIAIAAIYHVSNFNLPSIGFIGKKLHPQRDNIKYLPAPDDNQSYVIFSDIHRDEEGDKRPPFEFGSIDHFLDNSDFYADLLEEILHNPDFSHTTVIEAGDCEELWFIRDFSVRPKERLQRIIDSNPRVYEALRELHRQGRYVRIYGNHDDYLRMSDVRQPLEDYFGLDAEGKPLHIYDYIVIQDVKTMDDPKIHIGFDSQAYNRRAPMLITHGHQWDFWNCDTNNIVGKLMVSAMATPIIDHYDDPFADMGGIAWAGSPLISFASRLANTSQFSNFPKHRPARRFAHHIQHMDDQERRLVNDVIYQESLVYLTSLTMKIPVSENNPTTFAEDHQICIGHTHYPQSNPYIDWTNLIPGRQRVQDAVSDVLGDRLTRLARSMAIVKTKYYNSGTVGWMEGVIWALRITPDGQARLNYWTHNTRADSPFDMDWELPLMDARERRLLDQKKGFLIQLLESIEFSPAGLREALLPRIDIPMTLEEAIQLLETLDDVIITAQSNQNFDSIFARPLMILLTGKTDSSFLIRCPLPSDVIQQLNRLESLFSTIPGEAGQNTLRSAIAGFIALKVLPLAGTSHSLFDHTTPTIWRILGLVMMLPADRDHPMFIIPRLVDNNLELVFHVRGQDTAPGMDNDFMASDISLRRLLNTHSSEANRMRQLSTKTRISLRNIGQDNDDRILH